MWTRPKDSPVVSQDKCCSGSSRRGAVVVLVAVLLVVMLGFTVLAVDVGYMYDARAELQNAADSAAMAAAAFLSSGTPSEAESQVKATAAVFAEINKAAGTGNVIDKDADVVLGKATADLSTGRYTFEPSVYPWDAVQVTVRRHAGSVSGPIGLFFAGFFGKSSADIGATAIAVLVPRDLAMVVDLSGSMNNDSELGSYKDTKINLTSIWRDLTPGSAGPTWGNMVVWGTEEIEPATYDPTTDLGLTYMPYGQNWSVLDVNQDGINDFDQLPADYSSNEINALKSGSRDNYDSSWYYANRVGVMLRLANWNDNDNDGQIDSSEVSWNVPYPYNQGSWSEWIRDYVRSSSTAMYQENSAFRYRFGLKTFVNYLLERRESNAESPVLAQTPEQPLEAVKQATDYCLSIIEELDSNDQLSLEVYATDAHHEVDLTEDHMAIAERLHEMQAGHYNAWTNIGGGLKSAIDELTGPRARPHARKIILLMTDGVANVDEYDRAGSYYEASAQDYAKQQADRAAALGIRIYSISVGVGADRSLMQTVATKARGEEFFAAGTSAEYSAQLLDIFGRLGGKRPVALIK